MNIFSCPIINECTSCQMCAAVCSRNAINIRLNEDGFYRPYVNEGKCTDCGLCTKVCYKYDDDVKVTALEETGNIDVIIEAFVLLCKKYEDVYLTIIGGSGFSKSYVERIDDMIEKLPYKSRINRKGLTPFAEIKEIMLSQHMFLFPSCARCEGHSNSLNEAMGQGLIPIVSDYHFNRAIVGDDRLMVDGYEPQAYADKIEFIRENYDLRELSINMRNRVRDNFSFDIVNNRIYKELQKI